MADPKRENPFTVLSSRDVYQNPWIRVVEHQVLNPKGRPGIYGVVHFKARAVGVVPYQDGDVWLVGQYRFPLEAYSWEIPEGGAPGDETLEDCARRELAEETGLRAETLEPIVRLHLSNSVSDEYGVVFLARGIHEGEAAPEETEELEVRRVPFDEAYRMVVSGAITDSLSVAALLRLRIMQLEGTLG